MRLFRSVVAATASTMLLVLTPVRAIGTTGGGPAIDVPAPFFWDAQAQSRAGGAADRFELDDPTRAADVSAWYHLSAVPGGDRLQVHEHNAPTMTGPATDIAGSENVAWHVANSVLGRTAGLARAGEIPGWARPRTGNADGTSAGLLFALADVDLLSSAALAGGLRVAATGTIGSDGTITSVRMVDAKLAAARLAQADVVFAPDFPAGRGSVTRVPSHIGRPDAGRTIGDWVGAPGYEAAGRRAAADPGPTALVAVDDLRQALAWLCGRTGAAATCAVAHAAAAAPLSSARPYGVSTSAHDGAARGRPLAPA